MPCSACGHGSSNTNPPVLFLGRTKTVKSLLQNVSKSFFPKQKPNVRFNMFRQMKFAQ